MDHFPEEDEEVSVASEIFSNSSSVVASDGSEGEQGSSSSFAAGSDEPESDADSNADDSSSFTASDEGTPIPEPVVRGTWLNRIAILGNSSNALLLSTALVALAISFSWYLQIQESRTPEERAYRKLGSLPRPRGPTSVYEIHPQKAATEQISRKMKDAYQHDGVIALRGLIPDSLLQDLQMAADQLILEQHYSNAQKRFKVRGKQFFTVHHGAIFRTPESLLNRTITADETPEQWATNPMNNPFLRLMVQTSLSQVAATLLHHTMSKSNGHSKDNLRILRDIFLAKDDDPFVCGWHVDDHGFWPALADAPGINLWIALDDYNDTVTTGGADSVEDPPGGFALAVGSHVASWRDEAYHVTGAAHTVPPEGFKSAIDMVNRREGSGTCNIAHSAPHLQRRLEETKRVYRDLRAGDVIFHDRWLFHRTIPQDGQSNTIKRRYSVRLGPGTAVIPKGYGTEPSVLYNEDNGGKTSDAVSEIWPFYPRVFPSAVESEMDSWREFCLAVYPDALEKQEARKREMKPHLQRMAQRQQIHPQANNRLFDFSEGYT